MPKQISVTREMVDQTVFELALTARNVTQRAGCSTQPIYKIYRNLEELRTHTIKMVQKHAEQMIFTYRKTSIPFFNTGLVSSTSPPPNGFCSASSTSTTTWRSLSFARWRTNACTA